MITRADLIDRRRTHFKEAGYAVGICFIFSVLAIAAAPAFAPEKPEPATKATELPE